jgi:hypothetical protein
MAQYVEIVNVMTLVKGLFDFKTKAYTGRVPGVFLYQSPDGLIRIGFEKFAFEYELARHMEDFMGGNVVPIRGILKSVINVLLPPSYVSWGFHISLNLRYYDSLVSEVDELVVDDEEFGVEELAFFISEYFYDGYGISRNFSLDNRISFCCCEERVN